MALPKISAPLFDAVVPSTKQTIRLRPFLVKEEKILLLAAEADTEREGLLAIKQVVNNCIMEEGFDIDQLTLFDLEYLFIVLRARSVNNIVEMKVTDEEDGQEHKVMIDLDAVQIDVPKETTYDVQLADDVILRIKYPTLKTFETFPDNATAEQILESVVYGILDCIFVGDEMTSFEGQPEEEIREFLDHLPMKANQDITKFTDNFPTVYYDAKYKNSLGNEKVISLRGLQDFFM